MEGRESCHKTHVYAAAHVTSSCVLMSAAAGPTRARALTHTRTRHVLEDHVHAAGTAQASSYVNIRSTPPTPTSTTTEHTNKEGSTLLAEGQLMKARQITKLAKSKSYVKKW